jgi:hypothetical protein
VRRTALPAAVAVLAGVPALVGLASPAQAYATPTFSDIDVSTPGHAKVTVTTDAPYVVAWLRSTTLNVRVGDPAFVSTTDGPATVDLETWGVDSGQVMVRDCQTADVTACDPIVLSPAFVPSTVDPVITWPADDTVGAADVYSPEVADPDGGGQLLAVWSGQRTPIAAAADNALPLTTEGAGTVTVLRCSAFAANVCAATGVSQALTVNRRLSAVADATPVWISPALGAHLEPVLTAQEGLANPFSLEWTVVDASGTAVDGASGLIDGLDADDQGRVHPSLDMAGVPDGTYGLRGRLFYVDPEFGEVSFTLPQLPFTLDRVAPSVSSITFSSPTVYPYRDLYQDHADAIVVSSETGARLRLNVTDAQNALVSTQTATMEQGRRVLPWSGHQTNGGYLAAGTYTMTMTVRDAANNVVSASHAITVVHERIHKIRITSPAYTATSTLKEIRAGACSQVVRPASRKWAGSLELRSNGKCQRTAAASTVRTIHSVKLPELALYSTITLSTYGGSSVGARGSVDLRYEYIWGTWGPSDREYGDLGWHVGPRGYAKRHIGDDRTFTWQLSANGGSHYDVKSFTLDILGYELVPE